MEEERNREEATEVKILKFRRLNYTFNPLQASIDVASIYRV